MRKETRGMRNNNEEWKDIPGYEGRYQISSLGRVKSLPKYKCNKDIILKGDIDKDGYKSVTLCPNNHERKRYRVHRLVAMTFIENKNNYPEVDHINTIRDDNRVENLRWVNRSINQLNELTRKKLSLSKKGIPLTEARKEYQKRVMKGKRHGVKNLLESNNQKMSAVLMLDINENIIMVFSSMKEASLVTNINQRRISDVCNNKRNKAGGFVWRKI